MKVFLKLLTHSIPLESITLIEENDNKKAIIHCSTGDQVIKITVSDMSLKQIEDRIEKTQNEALIRRLKFVKEESDEIWKVLFGKEIIQ